MAYGFVAILFMLVPGSFGQEASLLQVSQLPAVQGQQQAPQAALQVPVPPAQPLQAQALQAQAMQAQAQMSQSSLGFASTGVHNSYGASAPTGAVIPGAASFQAPVVAPNDAAVLTATASHVKSTQAAQANETALAFSQLTSLDTEFKELHADDASHVRQLTYNVHLREQLQEKLRQAEEQLAEDNEHLAERTMQIIAGGEAVDTSRSGDSQASAPAESNGNETFAALLLEAAVVSRRNRELNNAQIAAQALDRVKALVEDITALRARDEEEIQALRANAQSRDALRKKIEQRSDQLHEDTDLLLKDLGQIRDLVAKDESSLSSAGSTVDAASTSPKQDAAQTEATSNA